MQPSHEAHRHTTAVNEAKKDKADLGILGVLIHIAGDALNNLGVIIVGAVIWKTTSPGRFYADPAIGVFIAVMIFLSSIPLG
jgi:zinc transporter 1